MAARTGLTWADRWEENLVVQMGAEMAEQTVRTSVDQRAAQRAVHWAVRSEGSLAVLTEEMTAD